MIDPYQSTSVGRDGHIAGRPHDMTLLGPRLEENAIEPGSMSRWCSVALKEWAVVCQALRSGRQTLLLRKGGLSERRGEFSVERDAFWLYPTLLHQARDRIVEDAVGLFGDYAAPRQGEIRLDLFAVVHSCVRIEDLKPLERLTGMHIWSDAVVRERFQYKRPGIHVMLVRTYLRQPAHELIESPTYGGCTSWVDLEPALEADRMTPVLDNASFEATASRVAAAIDL